MVEDALDNHTKDPCVIATAWVIYRLPSNLVTPPDAMAAAKIACGYDLLPKDDRLAALACKARLLLVGIAGRAA